MGNFDPRYMDDSTRIIHAWSERSYNDLTTMFSGEIANCITKVITRWCVNADELPSGMWVFVRGGGKANVFTPDMMLGYSGAGPAYCEMFLKYLGVDASLIEQKSQTIKGSEIGVVTFTRTDEGWDALATTYGPKL